LIAPIICKLFFVQLKKITVMLSVFLNIVSLPSKLITTAGSGTKTHGVNDSFLDRVTQGRKDEPLNVP
jgi:hypothetical protein